MLAHYSWTVHLPLHSLRMRPPSVRVRSPSSHSSITDYLHARLRDTQRSCAPEAIPTSLPKTSRALPSRDGTRYRTRSPTSAMPITNISKLNKQGHAGSDVDDPLPFAQGRHTSQARDTSSTSPALLKLRPRTSSVLQAGLFPRQLTIQILNRISKLLLTATHPEKELHAQYPPRQRALSSIHLKKISRLGAF